jgi:hypothetical protein
MNPQPLKLNKLLCFALSHFQPTGANEKCDKLIDSPLNIFHWLR